MRIERSLVEGFPTEVTAGKLSCWNITLRDEAWWWEFWCERMVLESFGWCGRIETKNGWISERVLILCGRFLFNDDFETKNGRTLENSKRGVWSLRGARFPMTTKYETSEGVEFCLAYSHKTKLIEKEELDTWKLMRMRSLPFASAVFLGTILTPFYSSLPKYTKDTLLVLNMVT